MNVQIYVLTHETIETIDNEIYFPLQIGRSDQKLSGIYRIWKDVKCDIVGICRYNQYFVRDERLLESSYIEETIQRYPMIISPGEPAGRRGKETLWEKTEAGRSVLRVCREVIAGRYPEYEKAFDFSIRTDVIPCADLMIARKDMFDRYCMWLSDILSEVEKRITTADVFPADRLADRLFHVWLLMQPERIREECVKQIEPKDFKNAEKKVELVYQYVKLKIKPVIQLYQADPENGSLAGKFECKDDFDGKIPVWICWWQGEAEMPELIRCCIDSLKRNLPFDTVSLRMITLENCQEYVTFTGSVIRKFNEGNITYTQLSDILRAELLYRYGGMWIDATYYVTSPIPKDIFRQEGIYTLRFRKALWGADITQGRWSGNLWCTAKGSRLFAFLMDSLWYYWETEDELIDYFLIDYVIAAAAEYLPEVKEELENCPFTDGKVFELHQWMNRKYTDSRRDMIRTASLFYKLYRRADYKKQTITGEQTMYGFILGATE